MIEYCVDACKGPLDYSGCELLQTWSAGILWKGAKPVLCKYWCSA